MLLGDLVNEGFFYMKMYGRFARQPKNSGCNIEVTILLEVAVRQGFTVV